MKKYSQQIAANQLMFALLVGFDLLHRQFDHCNFRGTVVANRQKRAADARARVTQHTPVAPLAVCVRSGTISVAENASDHRQADLSGVNMTAKTKIDLRSRGLFKYFGRV